MQTTIYKSYGMFSLEELEQEIKDAKEFLTECYNEEYPTLESVDDERATDEVYDRCNMAYEDEHMNLDKQLNGRVLAIASLGLWNGRKTGYKILSDNLNEVLNSISCDEIHVYCDKYNVKAKGYHHDGSNYVEYREIREDRNIDNLLDKLYMGKPVTRNDINYYTKSLRPYVAEIYGI